MKRSDLESDAAFILESMKDVNYEIPTNRKIMGFIFGWLKYVYLMQLFFVVTSFFIYNDSSRIQYQAKIFISLFLISIPGMLFFSLGFIISTYNSVCVFFILRDDVRRKSILINLIINKIIYNAKVLFFINFFVGCFLVWCDEPFIAGLGFSWFMTFIVSMVFLQASLSRYMTPVVVSTLTKARELISPSTKDTLDNK